jgi:hypothetical protein
MDETPGRSDPSAENFKAEALLEAGCLTTVPGYCDGGPLFVAAGLSAVLSINKTTGTLYMKVRPGSASL